MDARSVGNLNVRSLVNLFKLLRRGVMNGPEGPLGFWRDIKKGSLCGRIAIGDWVWRIGIIFFFLGVRER